MVFMGASKSDDVLGDTVGCGMLQCHARSPEADRRSMATMPRGPRNTLYSGVCWSGSMCLLLRQ
jgi:hypothetical protein